MDRFEFKTEGKIPVTEENTYPVIMDMILEEISGVINDYRIRSVDINVVNTADGETVENTEGEEIEPDAYYFWSANGEKR